MKVRKMVQWAREDYRDMRRAAPVFATLWTMGVSTVVAYFIFIASLALAGDSVYAEYGPIVNPGSADAAVIVDGRPIQIEYLHCLPELVAGDAKYWEDGSISC